MKKKKETAREALMKAAKRERKARVGRRNLGVTKRKERNTSQKIVTSGPGEGSVRSLVHDSTRAELVAALRVKPIPSSACDKVGVSYRAFQHHYRTDKKFADLVDQAKVEGWEKLEAATFDEAMTPSTPGMSTGKLKEFMLKGRKRAVYGDKLNIQAETRHTVTIDLVPAIPSHLGASGDDVVDAEAVELLPAAESEEP